MPADHHDPTGLDPSSTDTPRPSDLRAVVTPTQTWADDVSIIPYVARVWRLRTGDLGPGTPPLSLSAVVDPPVCDVGAYGGDRPCGAPARAPLHRSTRGYSWPVLRPVRQREECGRRRARMGW